MLVLLPSRRYTDEKHLESTYGMLMTVLPPRLQVTEERDVLQHGLCSALVPQLLPCLPVGYRTAATVSVTDVLAECSCWAYHCQTVRADQSTVEQTQRCSGWLFLWGTPLSNSQSWSKHCQTVRDVVAECSCGAQHCQSELIKALSNRNVAECSCWAHHCQTVRDMVAEHSCGSHDLV